MLRNEVLFQGRPTVKLLIIFFSYHFSTIAVSCQVYLNVTRYLLSSVKQDKLEKAINHRDDSVISDLDALTCIPRERLSRFHRIKSNRIFLN